MNLEDIDILRSYILGDTMYTVILCKARDVRAKHQNNIYFGLRSPEYDSRHGDVRAIP
jgi:hypothetical protein